MKNKTRYEYLNELIQQLPKPESGFRYEIDYNSVYGGYRLVKVKEETGAHYGAFGGNGCESRVDYKTFLIKLNTIIETVKTISA
jgi:hypothetical protein